MKYRQTFIYIDYYYSLFLLINRTVLSAVEEVVQIYHIRTMNPICNAKVKNSVVCQNV